MNKDNKEVLWKRIIYTTAFLSTVVYIVYRIFFTIPIHDTFINVFIAVLIVGLEFLEAFVYSIYYFNVLLFKKDSPKTPKIKKEQFPEIDILIATINEDVELLQETIKKIKAMKYPDKKKLHIYLCDDGRRKEMKDLCKKLKINYIDRKDNKNAKAGNYNHALEKTKSPYIVTFDADMQPKPEFLMKTVPHIIANDNVGFVQIPQNFRNPDIYQARFKLIGKIPHEQDYFFNKIQMAKNYTNSVIYCGTNTVFLRKALEEAGGFATESVTEDIATGIIIESLGYRGIGINEKMVFGLNVNNLDSYIKQKCRWGRGCIQTFKNYNVLRNDGLSLRQKADYFSTLYYWTYGIRQILYMIIPLLFPFFNVRIIKGSILTFTVLFFIQYILKRYVVDATEGHATSSTWNRIYETILFPTVSLDLFREVFNVGSKKFYVSPKKKEKNVMTRANLYMMISHLVIFFITLIALGISIYRAIDFRLDIYIIPIFWLLSNLFYLTIAVLFDLSLKEQEDVDVIKTRTEKYNPFVFIDLVKNFIKEEFGFKKLAISFATINLIIASIFGINNYYKEQIELRKEKHLVSENGWLHVEGNMIKNEKNKLVHLRGINSHSPYWYGYNYTYNNLKTLRDNWGINIFRIAMFTNPEMNGYINDQENRKVLIKQIVDICIKLDIYVIIDWHILDDNNPMTYKEEAKEFFDEMSKEYKDVPNVLYEICNEPNGDEVTWDDVIKPYAEEVIDVIRNNSKNSFIIVGTADWCKDTPSVIKNPLQIENIMYAVHTYMGNDIYTVQDNLKLAIKEKLPVIITECAATDGTGDGYTYLDYFQKWVGYLEENNLSWMVWQFSDRGESSSLIIQKKIKDLEYITKGIYSKRELEKKKYNINDYLSETGKVTRKLLRKYSLKID